MLSKTSRRAALSAQARAQKKPQDRRVQQHRDSVTIPESSRTFASGLRKVSTSIRALASSRRVSPSERIESSDRKMITSVTEQEHMKKGKKNPPPELEPIPPVDEAEFTEVVRKMVNTSPVTRKDVEHRGYRRKKNPETDPRKIKMFNLEDMPSSKRKG
jgi:hypothetical protein